MPVKFDDYHRTVIGYHGTRLSTALNIVSRKGRFKKSENDDDWLGHGVYFWEYGPQQALWWAERRRKRQGWDEPIAILASMIRLGFCFDLLDPYNVKYLEQIHDEYATIERDAGRKTLENANNHKYLDCAAFQFAYALIEEVDSQRVDSARAVYVPTGNGKRVWKRSWISRDAHVQICVRDPRCILGTWLHYPTDLEQENEQDKTAADEFEPEDQAGGADAKKDAVLRSDSITRRRKADEPK
jgi:hypothetical protein